MKIFLKTLCILIICSIIASCATRKRYNPFIVEGDELKKNINIVAFIPVRTPKPENIKGLSRIIEKQVTDKLTTAGFKVIESGKYKKIWESNVKKVNGIYDSMSGEVDKEKRDTAINRTTKYLMNKYGINGFVQAEIIVVRARWGNNTAAWHRAKEHVTGKSGFMAAIDASGYSGTIPALSLRTLIIDTNRKINYSNAGGIQLLQHRKNKSFVNIKKENLLSSEDKITKAIKIALKPLMKKYVKKIKK